MKQAAIIIPTTGAETVWKAVESALAQTYENTKVYLVTDGIEYTSKVVAKSLFQNYGKKFVEYYLPENTGANGQNGHRIYSAFSFLVDADYILYLDQDCWFDEHHVEKCIDEIESKNLDWCYSLRKIVSKEGEYICNDDCESLGKYAPVFNYNLCDTSTYCIKREVAMLVAPYFVGGWGHDRRYFEVLSNNFQKFESSGEYTLNYRLGGDNNLTGDFWISWNKEVEKKYNGKYPWRNNG
jgi:glycosyltransferase involved in cell wall biosynthesis